MRSCFHARNVTDLLLAAVILAAVNDVCPVFNIVPRQPPS